MTSKYKKAGKAGLRVEEAKPFSTISDIVAIETDAQMLEGAKGIAEATVIQPGFNKSRSRFYPKEVLKRDHKIFEGVKMFLNHPTRSESRERPERDIEKFVGVLTNVHAREDGSIAGTPIIHDPRFRETLQNLSESKLLGHMGLSIVASGKGRPGKAEGHSTIMVEGLTHGHSVDFVATPAAGGQVHVFESDDEIGENEMDLTELQEALATATKGLAAAETQRDEALDKLNVLESEKTELTRQIADFGKKEEARDRERLLTEAVATESAEVLSDNQKTQCAAHFHAASRPEEAMEAKVKGHVDEWVESITIDSRESKGRASRRSIRDNGPTKDGNGATNARQELYTNEKAQLMREGVSEADAERHAKEVACI